ncbi:MAG: cation diffusion facilitator family transporter [Clostridia bacterium]|nr:cation diffusion facilitator family transporter [Clostridia bacterium]
MSEKQKTVTPEERLAVGRRAGIVGIVANLFLFAVKLFAGILSASVSVIADALNNLSDAGSSIFLFVGYRLAGKPADKKHPYGYSRMEYLCGLFISVIVTVLGIELLKSSVEKLIAGGGETTFNAVSVIIMGAAVLVKGGLALFYAREGKRIDSTSLRGSAADSIGDVFATLAVLAGILLAPITGPLTDGIIGCLIAVYIIVLGVKLVREASATLLGSAPSPELVHEIASYIRQYEGVIGIHDLVIHEYGAGRIFASVHVEVDADVDVMLSHDRMDNIEAAIARDMDIHLVVHMDPVCISDDRVNRLRGEMFNVISEVSSETGAPVSMHDFRVVFGVTHSNLVFDVAVPVDFPLSNEDLCERIAAEAKRIDEHYNTVITVDRDYSSARYGEAVS